MKTKEKLFHIGDFIISVHTVSPDIDEKFETQNMIEIGPVIGTTQLEYGRKLQISFTDSEPYYKNGVKKPNKYLIDSLKNFCEYVLQALPKDKSEVRKEKIEELLTLPKQ